MRITVLLLSCGWLLAQTLASPFLAAAVCVGAISSCAALGLRRRPLTFGIILAGLGITIAAFLTYCLTDTFSAGGGFIIQILFILVLAPIIPLVYALSFPEKPQ